MTQNQSRRPAPVLLTGASSGIGAATARVLSSPQRPLILTGRNLKRLEKLQGSLSGPSQIVIADFSHANVAEKIDEAIANGPFKKQKFGGLINNAGIIHRLSFLQTSETDWQQELNVNLLSPVRLLRLFIPQMETGSVIVNVSSTLGLRPIANTSLYSATKAALNSLTQALALELAPHIRVCGVCPGLIDTEIHDFHSLTEESPEKIGAHRAQPMGRMGRPEEVAQMIKYLMSPEASWITGSLMTIDGGISLL